jgi:CubicO group peptidase (beta-lactamase class C family)
MPHSQLPISTPSAEGVDASGILSFVDALEASPTQDPHSLMILRNGAVIAQGWWSPYAPERRHLLYSLSKSFTSAAAGIALGEGLLDLDAPVISYFPEFNRDITDARSRRMLVRHVASMSSGHTYDTLDKAIALDQSEPVRGFLLLPPEEEPGTVFAYNQPATYTLAAIVQKLTGGTLIDYLRPRLFDPLGIGPVGWQQFPPGRDIGFSGLYATTDAIARLGQLNLQRGLWQGERILPTEWVEQATVAQVPTTVPFPAEGDEAPNTPDWQQGYGFQFWMARHGYRGDGAFGQFMLVLPEQNAVVAITSQTENMQETLDLAWEHLLPAFRFSGSATPTAATAGANGSAGDDRLVARLADLSRPLPTGAAGASDAVSWPDATFAPAAGRCAQQPSLASMRIRPEGAGARIELGDAGGTLTAPVGHAEWAVTDRSDDPVPMAVCGGLDQHGVVHVDIAFIETPHRMRVACDPATSTFEARWVTQPLQVENTPLTDLATPPPIG